MCHFALPRPSGIQPNPECLDPRYAEDCLTLFQRSIARYKTRIGAYEAKIFGGGNLYSGRSNRYIDEPTNFPIGDKNAAAAFQLLMDAGAKGSYRSYG